MQIENRQTFPMELPIIVEDELFLYPFMITPLFLSDEKNIEALELAQKKPNYDNGSNTKKSI